MMFDLVVNYLDSLVPLLLPLISLRVTFDWFRSLVFDKGF